MARESHSLTLAGAHFAASPRSPQQIYLPSAPRTYDTLNNHRVRAHGERENSFMKTKRHTRGAHRHSFLPADKTEKYFERKIIHAPARFYIVYVFACVKMLILVWGNRFPHRLPLGTVVWFASLMKCLSSQLAFSQSNNWAQRVSLWVCLCLCIMQLHQSGCALISERAVISFGASAFPLYVHGSLFARTCLEPGDRHSIVYRVHGCVWSHTHTLDIDPSSNPPLNTPHVDTLSLMGEQTRSAGNLVDFLREI